MPHSRACVCIFCIFGIASGQAPPPSMPPKKATTTTATKVLASTINSAIEPIVLSRAALEDKVVTLRLAPRMATSIRMPEPVNSVVLGDPESFLAEHSEREPEIVTVKPIISEQAQTNLLITTTLGHQLNILLVSDGETGSQPQPVDVLLNYGKRYATSFLVEEDPLASSFIAETQKINGAPNPRGIQGPGFNGSTGETGSQLKPASLEGTDSSSRALEQLLERQKHASLPELYGQKPGEIETGQRVKAGVSEVLDQGSEVVVLFSVVNPSSHAIEIMPPQVQLGGKVKKKWGTAEQLTVTDFRLSTRRLGAGQRGDGVVVFERPAFKQSSETLFLQVADSGAVDRPALAPIGFGISSFRGGSAYGTGRKAPNQ
jgi:hypothetical protein